MGKAFFEGKQITINDMPEGPEVFYLVKLRSHGIYAGPRVKREEIMGFIRERNWQELDVEVSSANFPFAKIYEPQSRKAENPKPALPNMQPVGPGIPRVQRTNFSLRKENKKWH